MALRSIPSLQLTLDPDAGVMRRMEERKGPKVYINYYKLQLDTRFLGGAVKDRRTVISYGQ